MNILIPSFIVAIAIAVIGFGGIKYAMAYRLYQEYGYYFLFAGVAIWVYKFLELTPKVRALKFLLRRHWVAIVTAFFVVCFMFIASPPNLRILSDETNLLSVSQAMYEDHSIVNTTQKYCYSSGFYDRISTVLEKRPLLYPFAISAVHVFCGYSYKNAFVVNGIAMFIGLIAIYFIALPYLGRLWSFSAMLIMAAFPIVVLYTTSAGFDIFNMVWSLIMFAAFLAFLKYKSAKYAEFLLYTALMLAYTRYESVVTVLLVVPFIMYCMHKTEYESLSLASVIYPVLVLPIILITKITYNPKSLQVDSLEEAFSIGHFTNNLKLSMPFFFGSRYDYGMPGIIAWLSIISIVFIVIGLFIKKKNESSKTTLRFKAFIVFAIVFYIYHAIVKFSFYWGNLTLQYTSRLGLIFVPILVLFGTYGLKRIADVFALKKFVSVLLPIFVAFYGWSAAGQNLAVREIVLFRQFKSVREYLERHFPNKSEYLLVAPVANLYVPLEYSVISPSYFNTNFERVMEKIRVGCWRKIIFVQKIHKNDGEIASETKIEKPLEMNKLIEINQLNDIVIRISSIDFE